MRSVRLDDLEHPVAPSGAIDSVITPPVIVAVVIRAGAIYYSLFDAVSE